MRPMILLALPAAAFMLGAQALPGENEANSGEEPATDPRAEMPNLAESRPENCERAIEQVRDANGQPQLRRGLDMADDALMIAAVDKRIDGCAVIQVHGDVLDLRPVPPPSDKVRLIPAED